MANVLVAFVFFLVSFWAVLANAATEMKSGGDDSVEIFHPTPTVLLPLEKWPSFEDDLDFLNMELAIERQIRRFKEKDLTATVNFGDRAYVVRDQLRANQDFLKLSRETRKCLLGPEERATCFDRFTEKMKEQFSLYVPNTEEPAFFTAYYTPTLVGSSEATEELQHAIYKRPRSSSLRSLSRVAIDFDKKLEGKGLGMGYFPDLFDLFLLHVQGGGKIIVDGVSQYISYDGTNSKPFKFICKYMKEQGFIEDCQIKSQRKFLDENPDKHREIYATSPSYVWFKKTSTPPLGNDSVPLTDYRSIAQDSRLYRHKGTLAFIKTVKPIPKEDSDDLDRLEPYSRFFIDQDTGGAIKGAARADLYFGEGPDAPFVAYNMKYEGEIYFLMPRD